MRQPVAVYQAVAGAPGGTYYAISAAQSLKEWDADESKAIMEALGEEGGKKLLALEREIFLSTEENLYAINPKMSRVSKETASVAPDFWTPKPKSAAKPAAATAAKEATKKQ